MTGIYIHVPFCVSKCPYCDFYSLPLGDSGEEVKDAYVRALENAMRPLAGTVADTLYFGGGTPSLLGGKRLAQLIQTARELFSLPASAEITLEANPADDLRETLHAFAAAGGNRLSLGMQSSSAKILQTLGRRHTPQDVEKTVRDAQKAGIQNISLDIMLAVPGQHAATIRQDVASCMALGATHVSAYLLKLEPGTPFYAHRAQLALPDDDGAAELYLTAVDTLMQAGYIQYEISNFAQSGQYSRHNRKYWESEPYLGFGPAAHSFFDGKRFAYPRDLRAFLAGGGTVPEPQTAIPAGGEVEYAMLRLRLTDGLRGDAFAEKFGHPLPQNWLKEAAKLPKRLVTADANGIAFTAEGFLVSNSLIGHILNL